MADDYRTIETEVEAEFKDRGSKFIAYLFPMTTEEELAEKITELKSLHLKARHHCPAFRLRTGLSRSSDDGEPSGSAGKPILNQLLSAELVDVGCVVVRYFGGTKLGVSGLINAYKLATKYAVESAQIITKYETEVLVISFDYSVMGTLMNVLKQLDYKIIKKDLAQNPNLSLEINKSEVEACVTNIKAKLLKRSFQDIEDDTEVPGVRFSIPT